MATDGSDEQFEAMVGVQNDPRWSPEGGTKHCNKDSQVSLWQFNGVQWDF